MREFYLFFFCLSVWVSDILESDSNSCLTVKAKRMLNYLDKAQWQGRGGVLDCGSCNPQIITLSLTTLHFSRKKHALDPASPRQL